VVEEAAVFSVLVVLVSNLELLLVVASPSLVILLVLADVLVSNVELSTPKKKQMRISCAIDYV